MPPGPTLQLPQTVVAQSSTYNSAIHTARTDWVLGARFELAAYVNVNKPDSRQNANPRPRHPGARQDETATLTAASAALTALTEVKQICLQSTKRLERQCMAAACIPFVSLASDDALLSKSDEREVISLSWRCHGLGGGSNLQG